MGAGGARVHGRRFRRHRHEPALYAQRRGKVRQSRRTGFAGSGARHRVADLLVADRRHLDQIRDPDHARRQPRRRRHSGAAGACQPAARQAQPMARRHGGDRPRRRHSALRRRHDHPGDFGLKRDRGTEDLCAPNEPCRGPADGRHPRRPVSHPAQRNLLHRRDLRAGDAGLVHHRRRPRRRGNRQVARRARGAQSARRHQLSLACRTARLCRDWRRLPGGDRRRSVLRRYGPFRATPDPDRLVRRGAARAHPQLFRPRRPAPRRAEFPRRDRQPVLRACAGMGALSACSSGDRRHHHRLAVDHLRRLFPHAAGDQSRFSAAHEGCSHRGPGDRPDLCALRQLGARRRHARRRHRLRLVGRAGRRVWHRRFASDGDHHV